jgi:hypothetical protein
VSCVQCGQQVEPAFRYCPWCGSAQRRKLVEFFRGHDDLDRGRSLRVSRYFRTPEQEPHVRFSVWNEEGVVQAAVSIDEEEAARLGALLTPRPARKSRRTFLRL